MSEFVVRVPDHLHHILSSVLPIVSPYWCYMVLWYMHIEFTCITVNVRDAVPLSEVPSSANEFHACRSVASISEMPVVAPSMGSKQPLLRRLSEPLGRACTCPSSIRHMADMEGTITFAVPELSEKTLMNVSFGDQSQCEHTILMATSQSNGNGQTSTPHRIKTP